MRRINKILHIIRFFLMVLLTVCCAGMLTSSSAYAEVFGTLHAFWYIVACIFATVVFWWDWFKDTVKIWKGKPEKSNTNVPPNIDL